MGRAWLVYLMHLSGGMLIWFITGSHLVQCKWVWIPLRPGSWFMPHCKGLRGSNRGVITSPPSVWLSHCRTICLIPKVDLSPHGPWAVFSDQVLRPCKVFIQSWACRRIWSRQKHQTAKTVLIMPSLYQSQTGVTGYNNPAFFRDM